MASTNKTTHYELSQFLGTDKPSWLSDYNADMSKIDTGINSAQTTATGADGKADSANTAIGTLANLTTDVKTDLVSAINEVDGHADTAQQTANNASASATTANQKATALESYFNIKNFTTYDSITPSTYITYRSGGVKIATNDTNDLFKLYGRLTVNNTAPNATAVSFSISSPFRPTSAITIDCCGMAFGYNYHDVDTVNMTIATNGTITFNFDVPGNESIIRLVFPPCLYFLKDFGD